MEFVDDGEFVPPAAVTTVFVQAWGAGGGGAVGGGAITGAGGGAGGLAWCVLPVQPGTPVAVDVGAGGAGGAGAANGSPGTPTEVDNNLGGVVSADGGGGASLLLPGTGGTGVCPGQGTVREGADGLIGNPTPGAGGQGGRPPVDGVVQPAPPGAGEGGDGGGDTDVPGSAGGDGYVVIWW
ncbi:glycine-rich domain-containing protein [Actinacidiphila glaucinigra]|uniref:glycine-rich domain-containing protein n=1 Tax=Actinacidiphila glaucinigra TaxID=235986 RepID=UPI000B780684|nr:hypothetical protein [Actinacidiphila glaucinigra]